MFLPGNITFLWHIYQNTPRVEKGKSALPFGMIILVLKKKRKPFRFWIGGAFWQMCHKIIMVSDKDTNKRCVLANNVK
jgi:hypothetical protein